VRVGDLEKPLCSVGCLVETKGRGVFEGVAEGDLVGGGVIEGELLGIPDFDTETLDDGVADGLIDRETVPETLDVRVADGLTDRETDPETLDVGVADGLTERETDFVGTDEGDAELEGTVDGD